MKKYILLLCAAVLASGTVLSQELSFSGEVKTGVYWEQAQTGDKVTEIGEIHIHDRGYVPPGASRYAGDSSSNEGRFRLNLQFDHKDVGMKLRFEQTAWTDTSLPNWSYAFAYGNFISNQLKISAGRLGDSPWGAGGPELWTELDTKIGVRTEIKPNLLPGLNVGFVLNKWNGGEVTGTKTLAEMLQESVVGASYTNDFFHIRFAYRFDSDLDADDEEFVYRIEERALNMVLEGFQIIANGYYKGINQSEGGRGGSEPEFSFQNWLYVQYAPRDFTASVRFGLWTVPDRQILSVKPGFYYNFFGNILNVGAYFLFEQDFGANKFYEGSPYLALELQPLVRLNFGDNFYTALVYDYRSEYAEVRKDTIKTTHWFNLQVVYAF
ncbi:MAG: hypothetical protein LBE74_03420 [Treponema sp.]|jgi:hypothetical protein|nr:hypothetical protein [Treponema sp.]